jgi:hypothetical protein
VSNSRIVRVFGETNVGDVAAEVVVTVGQGMPREVSIDAYRFISFGLSVTPPNYPGAGVICSESGVRQMWLWLRTALNSLASPSHSRDG